MGKIGDMKRRVEVVRPTTSKSKMGGVQESFAHVAYKMLSRKAAGDSPEGYVTSRLVQLPRYKYRDHWFSTIDTTMQIIDAGMTYNVLSVDVDPEDDKFVEILAEKVED